MNKEKMQIIKSCPLELNSNTYAANECESGLNQP